MPAHHGLLCNITLDLCGKSGGRPDVFLKTAAVLHENVFFYTGLWGNVQGFEYKNAEILASWAELEQEDQEKLAKNRRFQDLFLPAEELSDFSTFSPLRSEDFEYATQAIQSNLRNKTKEIMAAVYGVSAGDVDSGRLGTTWELIPRYVAQDYALLSLVSGKQEGISGLFTPFHASIYDVEKSRGVQPETQQVYFNDHLQADCIFPDFSLLSWDEIFELRYDPSIRSFRRRIFKNANSPFEPNYVNRSKLAQSYLNDLKDFYKQRKPKPLSTIGKGIAGNLPTGIPNPFSFLFSSVDIKNDIRDHNKFAWLHFVQQVEEMTENRR